MMGSLHYQRPSCVFLRFQYRLASSDSGDHRIEHFSDSQVFDEILVQENSDMKLKAN